jgi:hypothetical protein
MNLIEIEPPRRQAPVRGMLLHCGAETVGREQLFQVPTPLGTRTWFPLPHRTILGEVETQLLSSGFEITGETHALSHAGARYFCVLSVSLPAMSQADYSWVVGIRNSHDQTYPAGLVAGTRVFVCDNLAFTGEVRINRKHTRHAMRDLRHLTARAVGQLGDKFLQLDQRVDAYKGRCINDPKAHDLVIRAVDCHAITPTQVPGVLDQWRHPAHEAFQSRTLWSLFNAFTEVHKAGNPHTTLRRGEALHGLFDAAADLALAS